MILSSPLKGGDAMSFKGTTYNVLATAYLEKGD
jgi:hypothetical protein